MARKLRNLKKSDGSDRLFQAGRSHGRRRAENFSGRESGLPEETVEKQESEAMSVATAAKLERQVFETSRELEFFSEKELMMQIGYDQDRWPVALLKELIDNALDACEVAGIAPEIEVTSAKTISA